MDGPEVGGDRIERPHHWLLWVLMLGLVGTEAELLLLKHYVDAWQLAPVFLIALAGAVLIWHAIRRDRASVRAVRFLMGLFLVAGLAGVVLHFRGAAEFQLEIAPDMPRWDLIKKAVQAQAPPFLAPGAMVQLGLIGLVYSYLISGEKREMS